MKESVLIIFFLLYFFDPKLEAQIDITQSIKGSPYDIFISGRRYSRAIFGDNVKSQCIPQTSERADSNQVYKSLLTKIKEEDSLLTELEKTYRQANSPENQANALCAWEETITKHIRMVYDSNRTVFNIIQPDANGSVVSFTIEPLSSSIYAYRFKDSSLSSIEGDYNIKLESRNDIVEVQENMAGIFSIGNGSIFRFSGTIPFPLEKTIAKKLGSVHINGWLRRDDSHKAIEMGVTNDIIFSAQPIKNHLLFQGDKNDPLAFVVLKGLGLVYLHGKGSVVLEDGTTMNIMNEN